MTNREWLERLSDEELARFMMGADTCVYCGADGKECGSDLDLPCVHGKLRWLRAEHEEED